MIYIFYLLIPLVVLSIAINKVIINTPLRYIYFLIVRPGVILHEASHYLACLITFAPIKKISVFEKNGGYVKYSPSPMPYLGDLLISVAPTLIGSAIIIFASYKFGIKIESTVHHINFKDFFIVQTYYKSLYFWIYIYIILAIGTTFLPSTQDIKNSLWGFSGLIVIIYLLRNYPLSEKLFKLVGDLTPIIIFPLLVSFLAIFCLFLLNKFIFKLR